MMIEGKNGEKRDDRVEHHWSVHFLWCTSQGENPLVSQSPPLCRAASIAIQADWLAHSRSRFALTLVSPQQEPLVPRSAPWELPSVSLERWSLPRSLSYVVRLPSALLPCHIFHSDAGPCGTRAGEGGLAHPLSFLEPLRTAGALEQEWECSLDLGPAALGCCIDPLTPFVCQQGLLARQHRTSCARPHHQHLFLLLCLLTQRPSDTNAPTSPPHPNPRTRKYI